MFKITYSRAAIRELVRMPANRAKLIRSRIEAVAADPHGRQPQLAPLKGSDLFRLRVGDWRVIFRIDGAAHTIRIRRIALRGRVYE